MIEKTITEFKKQLRLRGYSYNTIETYGSCATLFLVKFQDEVPAKHQIEDWLLSYSSEVYRKHLLCSIKAFNKIIYDGAIDCETIPCPRPESKLPEILSIEEVQKIINVCANNKHKCIIVLLYACGLRISEVINLRWADVDRSRMVINIRQSKGKRDRQVPLPLNVIVALENYYRDYKSVTYVFNGQIGLQYTARSVQEFLKMYAAKAGIRKRVHPHQFRHSSFTEMFNNGTDSAVIQAIAGHKNRKTTMQYIRLATTNIAKVVSPINAIQL